MMLVPDIVQLVIRPGLALLPAAMTSPEAMAMLLAIGLQESRFKARRQYNGGPARGFYQFERDGGVAGVLQHPRTRPIVREILDRLEYDLEDPAVSHAAIEHNDALATAYARLLLWTLPDPLPAPTEIDEAWRQYRRAWRPGRPHRQTWTGFYLFAWDRVARLCDPPKTY
ncbi:MAG: hypothetical protein RBS34_02830 [Desulfofustis sp.]|jgi:hypothetical protein|nr:hypothetical protein [Desulfofustis sp.]